MTRWTRIVLISAVATAATLSVAAPASATHRAVIGSALNLPYQGGVCNLNCLSVQQSQVGGDSPHPLVSPVNGIITEWKVRTGDPNTQYSLWVMRPGPDNTYTGLFRLDAPSLSPATVTDDILTFPGRSVPIQQGNAIGLWQSVGATNGLPQNITNGITANVIANEFNGNLMTVGGTRSFLPDQQHELLLQATIDYCSVPSLKGLKRAAAVQALAAGDCAIGNVKKKKLKPSKKTKKKKGKIRSQSLPPGATAAPGTPVDVKINGLKKRKKKD